MNDYQYIEEAALSVLPDAGSQITIATDDHAKWYRLGRQTDGQSVRIDLPENSSVFLYDEDLNCVYSSLEVNFDNIVTLPDHGYILFAGEHKSFTLSHTNFS